MDGLIDADLKTEDEKRIDDRLGQQESRKDVPKCKLHQQPNQPRQLLVPCCLVISHTMPSPHHHQTTAHNTDATDSRQKLWLSCVTHRARSARPRGAFHKCVKLAERF